MFLKYFLTLTLHCIVFFSFYENKHTNQYFKFKNKYEKVLIAVNH